MRAKLVASRIHLIAIIRWDSEGQLFARMAGLSKDRSFEDVGPESVVQRCILIRMYLWYGGTCEKVAEKGDFGVLFSAPFPSNHCFEPPPQGYLSTFRPPFPPPFIQY